MPCLEFLQRHLDLTDNSKPQMAAEELPMIQENSSQSCGGNTRIGRDALIMFYSRDKTWENHVGEESE